MPDLICENCGKNFFRKVQRGKRIYCSYPCVWTHKDRNKEISETMINHYKSEKGPATRKKLKESLKNYYQTPKGIEVRKKIRERQKKNLNAFWTYSHLKRRPMSEEHKLKMREIALRRKSTNFKYFDTFIEGKVEGFLQNSHITYEKQYLFPKIAKVDFYLPKYNLVIQCDGCYWHGCPIHEPSSHLEKQKRDIRQDSELNKEGVFVLRLWEHEIRGDAMKIAEQKILNVCINTILKIRQVCYN